MGTLKILTITPEELKIGDKVLQIDGNNSYFIEEIGYTFLHHHKYFHCKYDKIVIYNGDITRYKRWTLEELKERKTMTVCRLV